MSDRLQNQLQRLYGIGPDAAEPRLIDANHRVRALVIALGRGASARQLADLWQGVQTELGLPAPAIAAAGDEGFQLWFALAEPVPAAQAQDFLSALQAHWLAELKPQRVMRWPAPHAQADAGWQMPAGLPRALDDERWAAFVSADLAPVFEDTPWLEVPPKPDGQAELLARLDVIGPADWQAAQQALRAFAPAPRQAPMQAPVAAQPGPAPLTEVAPVARGALVGPFDDPRDFLRAVMNDASAPLSLRLEAAKALLGAP